MVIESTYSLPVGLQESLEFLISMDLHTVLL
nr:MAG TPA: hypothetical protein [Caudoviricetes sp.]